MNTKKHIISFISLAFFLRLVFFVFAAPWKPENSHRLISHDSISYEKMADNIISGDIFTLTPSPKTSIYRTPTYPLLLAIVFGLFGKKYFLVILIQIILGVCSCFFVYKIGSCLFNEKIGILSGYLMAVEYLSIAYCMTILTETLFIFILLLAMVFWIRFLESKSIKNLSLSGVIMGMGALCKPMMLYFPVPLFTVYIFNGFRSQEKFNKRLKNTFIGILFFLLPITPWLARNAVIWGTPYLTTVKGFNLFYLHTAYLEAARLDCNNLWKVRRINNEEFLDKIKEHKLNTGKDNLNQIEVDSLKVEFALEKIKAHPFIYLKVHLLGMIALLFVHGKNIIFQLLGLEGGWTGVIHHLESLSSFWKLEIYLSLLGIWNMTNTGQKIVSLILLLYQLIFIIGIIYGSSVIFWQNRDKRNMRLLMVAVGYFWIISSPISSPRFKVILIPFFTLLFSLSFFSFFSRKHGPSPRKLVQV